MELEPGKNEGPKGAESEKTEGVVRRTSAPFKLRKTDGTVLAKCPTRRAGLKTAMALADDFYLRVSIKGQWLLIGEDSGSLMFTIGR